MGYSRTDYITQYTEYAVILFHIYCSQNNYITLVICLEDTLIWDDVYSLYISGHLLNPRYVPVLKPLYDNSVSLNPQSCCYKPNSISTFTIMMVFIPEVEMGVAFSLTVLLSYEGKINPGDTFWWDLSHFINQFFENPWFSVPFFSSTKTWKCLHYQRFSVNYKCI